MHKIYNFQKYIIWQPIGGWLYLYQTFYKLLKYYWLFLFVVLLMELGNKIARLLSGEYKYRAGFVKICSETREVCREVKSGGWEIYVCRVHIYFSFLSSDIFWALAVSTVWMRCLGSPVKADFQMSRLVKSEFLDESWEVRNFRTRRYDCYFFFLSV